jgi:1,2-phenylacetyl-CoA epoxidase catalytic subunit
MECKLYIVLVALEEHRVYRLNQLRTARESSDVNCPELTQWALRKNRTWLIPTAKAVCSKIKRSSSASLKQ